MRWTESWRADPVARRLADRHYSRGKPGTPQFVAAGRCLVLHAGSGDGQAIWVTSWPVGGQCWHEWAGAWMNSCFRNEGAGLSSELILEAIAATRHRWPEVPELGMVTFVDAGKVRKKRDPGRCYRKAGFKHVGFTKGGLWAFQLLPEDMPEPIAARRRQMDLFPQDGLH